MGEVVRSSMRRAAASRYQQRRRPRHRESVRRQRVGLTALQAYQICRTLAREPRFAKTLTPHVDNMKHVLAKYRAKRQRTPEPPAPQQIAA